MRFAVLAALSLVVSATTSLAATINIESLSVQRALDGKWQACSVAAHAGRTSWVLENTKAEGDGAVKVRVSGEMKFVRCVLNPHSNGTTDSPVMWVSANPQEKISSTAPSGKTVHSWFKNLEGLVVSEMNHLWSAGLVDGSTSISFNHVIDIDKILTENEQLDLADGKIVWARLGVQPRGLFFAHYEGEEASSLGMRTLGRYSIVLSMKTK